MFIVTLFYILLSILKTEVGMMNDPNSKIFVKNLEMVLSLSTASLSNWVYK